MKFLPLLMKLAIALCFFIACSSISFAQLKISAGGFIGGGTIKGESTSIGAFTSSVFIETNTKLFFDVVPRLSFIYAKDFDAILPNTKKPYLPYIQAITFKGITSQYFKSKLFIEEGIGFLILNDHTFSDTNAWSYGVALSLNGGWDLRDDNLNRIRLGAGVEYGITFNSTLAQYSSIHFYFNYSI